MNFPTPLPVLCFLKGLFPVGRGRAPTFGVSIGPTLLRKFSRVSSIPNKHHGVMKSPGQGQFSWI